MRPRRILDRLDEREGRPATIKRGSDSCPCIVRFGRDSNGAFNENNLIFAADSQDFLIQAKNYKPTGTLTEPQENDQIIVEDDETGLVQTFEALLPANSKQCFQSSGEGTLFRVYTKLMASE